MRVIPLDDQLADFLMPHLDTGYVIGGKEPPPLMVTRRLLRNLEKKIDMIGATPHVIRHRYISALAETGVDLKTIQQISGHFNVTTTIGIYAHTCVDQVKETGEKVGRLLTNNHNLAQITYNYLRKFQKEGRHSQRTLVE